MLYNTYKIMHDVTVRLGCYAKYITYLNMMYNHNIIIMMAVSFQRKYFITLEAQYNPYPKGVLVGNGQILVFTIIILERNTLC